MKTPDEIKKGLMACNAVGRVLKGESWCKEYCPYMDERFGCGQDYLLDDALAYIQQLEAKVDTLSAKAALFDDAMATGARMERERDALLKDIGSAQGCICIICKNYNNPNPGTGTAECNILGRFKDCGSDGALTCGQFKWRGVKEE